MKSYMIDWYRIPNKGALGLTLIMAMSNATIKLTAGKFMDLSLTSFCSVSKNIDKIIFTFIHIQKLFSIIHDGVRENISDHESGRGLLEFTSYLLRLIWWHHRYEMYYSNVSAKIYI